MIIVLTIAVFLLSVSKPGENVIGCLQECAHAPDPDEAVLKVVSLNMLHGHPDFEYLNHRMERIAAAIMEEGADLVLLQEVPWTNEVGYAAEYLANETGMNYAYMRANGNRQLIRFEEGEAILSRYPIQNVEFSVLGPQAGIFENRVVLHARIDAPGGSLDVFVTHLTHGDAQVNAEQTSELYQFVEAHRDGMAIIAGDFNAQDNEAQIMALEGVWLDVHRKVNPFVIAPTCCVSDLTAGPGEPLEVRIDYIFVVPEDNQPYELIGAERVLDEPFQMDGGWLWASDHVGLLAEFKHR